MKRQFELLGLVLLASTVKADSISIIQLQHRPAEELIPIVEPMLGANDDSGGTLVANGLVDGDPLELELGQYRVLVTDAQSKAFDRVNVQGEKRVRLSLE